MKRTLLVLALIAAAFGAQKPKPKQPAKSNPEEYWACGLGTQRERNGDHCLCPAMVSEIREEKISACAEKYGTGINNKAYVACMEAIPNECDIVKNADLKHPVHSCKRSCNAKAICRCHDGPACIAPPLPHDDTDAQ